MLYIIRHGQTDKNREGVLQGRSNVALNETGKAQARRLARYFREKGISFDRVYSSPLIRAVETARIAADTDQVATDDRLLEMDYGPYEGVSYIDPPEEIRKFFSDFTRNPAPEGMESLAAVTARLGGFLEEIAPYAGDQNILIATHAISMKGALEYLTPESNGSYWSKYIGNCGVYTAECRNGKFGIPEAVDADTDDHEVGNAE